MAKGKHFIQELLKCDLVSSRESVLMAERQGPTGGREVCAQWARKAPSRTLRNQCEPALGGPGEHLRCRSTIEV